MKRKDERPFVERGFTIIEVMVALSIIMLILYVGLNLVHQMSSSFLTITTRHAALGSIDALEARLRDDAKGAWESAATTCSSGTDKKVDFYTQDADGGHFWAYRYVDSVKSIYLVRNGTWTDVCTLTTTALTSQGLLMLSGLTSFTVETAPTTRALTDGSSPYVNQTALAARVAAIPLNHGIPVTSVPGVAAGNATLTNIQVQNPFAWRSIDLLPGVMPSGYTEALTFKAGARTTCGIGADEELAAKCHQGLNLSGCTANFNALPAIRLSASKFLYVGTVVFTFHGTDSMSITDPFAIYASESTWNSGTMGASNAAWFASFPKILADVDACTNLEDDKGLYNNGSLGGPSISTSSGNYASEATDGFCAMPYNPATYYMFNPVCATLTTSVVAGGSDGTSFTCSIGAPAYAGILLSGYVPTATQPTVNDVFNNTSRTVSGCPAVQSGV